MNSSTSGLFSNSLVRFLGSLQLTVILLVLAMILVFVGTLAQVHESIMTVQERYFHSFFVLAELGPIRFPFTGGYTLGTLLLINFVAAYAVNLGISWKRSGLILIHAGIVLLLLGELFTSLYAVEMTMSLTEGQTTSFAADVRHRELVFVDTSPADHNRISSFPESALFTGAVLTHPDLPFTMQVDAFYANSKILGPQQVSPSFRNPATQGVGRQLSAIPQPSNTRADGVDIPSAYITLRQSSGQTIGTWLVSMFLDDSQSVTIAGKTYLLSLRPKRYYQSFSMKLLDFQHIKYTGTDMAKSFASHVQVLDNQNRVVHDAVISMNNPLRYGGLTFYQASFDAETEKTSILQVVKNPSASIPYISCAVVSLGLAIHFLLHLIQWTTRPRR